MIIGIPDRFALVPQQVRNVVQTHGHVCHVAGAVVATAASKARGARRRVDGDLHQRAAPRPSVRQSMIEAECSASAELQLCTATVPPTVHVQSGIVLGGMSKELFIEDYQAPKLISVCGHRKLQAAVRRVLLQCTDKGERTACTSVRSLRSANQT